MSPLPRCRVILFHCAASPESLMRSLYMSAGATSRIRMHLFVLNIWQWCLLRGHRARATPRDDRWTGIRPETSLLTRFCRSDGFFLVFCSSHRCAIRTIDSPPFFYFILLLQISMHKCPCESFQWLIALGFFFNWEPVPDGAFTLFTTSLRSTG